MGESATISNKNYLNELNPTQRAAVTTLEGPVLVVAGPGSGKTRVLTYRIANLIQSGAKPWEILALTFTNKAAKEMKSRIEKVVGDKSANSVWAGTFHSVFARILRSEAPRIGYPSNFTIYDSDDTKSVISNIIKEMNLPREQYNPNTIRSRISMCKSKLITPKRYADIPQLNQEDAMSQMVLFREIYGRYTARCKRAGAMDFDDLLYRLYELLQNHEEVREKYQQKFRYVLVDEFQDTNTLQYAIVKKLVDYRTPGGSIDPSRPRNICVVGDDAQSIYAFRGATIQNILDFEKDFGPFGIQTFKLEQNYRSTTHIVEAANEVIQRNRNQIQKKIRSEKGVGERINIIRAESDNEEGKRVVDMILEQKNRHHLHNKDIAILYRTNSQSRVFEEYLRRYNVRYRVYGGQSFYQRKEVKDMLGYLRLTVNPQDEEALRRVINFPRRAIGNTSISKVLDFARKNNMGAYQALPQVQLPARTRKQVDGFHALIESFRKKATQEDAYEVAVYVARQSGLLKKLGEDNTIEGKNRLQNVQSLLDGIKEYVDTSVETVVEGMAPDKSLASYIQNISLLTDLDQEEDDPDHITLMSVHAAKGLEFPSVFVVGMEEELFPSFMSKDDPNGLDEERRLFYVAITRAEAFLTLSFAKSRYRFGKMKYAEPSRFLDEIDVLHLDESASVALKPTSQFGSTGFKSRDGQSQRARVSGSFKPRRGGTAKAPKLKIDPKDFKPSPSDRIATGQTVLHMKFGKGTVTNVDGLRDKRVASINFEGEDSERRLMLRFAKLQIVE